MRFGRYTPTLGSPPEAQGQDRAYQNKWGSAKPSSVVFCPPPPLSIPTPNPKPSPRHPMTQRSGDETRQRPVLAGALRSPLHHIAGDLAMDTGRGARGPSLVRRIGASTTPGPRSPFQKIGLPFQSMYLSQCDEGLGVQHGGPAPVALGPPADPGPCACPLIVSQAALRLSRSGAAVACAIQHSSSHIGPFASPQMRSRKWGKLMPPLRTAQPAPPPPRQKKSKKEKKLTGAQAGLSGIQVSARSFKQTSMFRDNSSTLR